MPSTRANNASPPTAGHLGPNHPLAEVAARHCFAHTGHRNHGIGRVACGACWERAIRDDERIVVECDLPREIEPDPDYVDEIAVDLACRGERVELTLADRREVARRQQTRTRQTSAQQANALQANALQANATNSGVFRRRSTPDTSTANTPTTDLAAA